MIDDVINGRLKKGIGCMISRVAEIFFKLILRKNLKQFLAPPVFPAKCREEIRGCVDLVEQRNELRNRKRGKMAKDLHILQFGIG